MSRTTRRNKQHLINSYVGTREESLRDPWHRLWNNEHLTPEQKYERHVHWYIRDHRSGKFGIPRWYRHEFGAGLKRRRERAAIHRHTRDDSWDLHLPESRYRDSMYYWWY